MRLLFTLLVVCGFFNALTAQNTRNFWTNVAAGEVLLPPTAIREFDPVRYHAFRLDFSKLQKTLLEEAPMEFAREQKTLLIELPTAEGRLETFAVRESPVMMPGLQAKHPEIRTFSGESVRTPGKRMRCTVSPQGFSAVLRNADYTQEYIEPIAKNQTEWYRAYFIRDFPEALRTKGVIQIDTLNFKKENLTDGNSSFAPPQEIEERGTLLGPVSLKIYRFAVSTTGEFSQDHGGTKASVLAALVGYTNTLNIVYEADLDIRLKLVDTEEKVIFLNPATDPFFGSEVGQWAGANPAVLNDSIGYNNYDLGHCFARYITGNAAGVAGGLCCTLGKASGCSSGQPPYGAGFLNIPGQEIGHQWDAGHTWNYCTANNQWSAESACEPGSGTTIMSYAGACGQYNIGQSELYYHACSIVEIRNFVDNGFGKNCGITEATTNNTPIASHKYVDGFFIPISTPFELVGDATDPDGDPNLTYCWDETDIGPYSPPGNPNGSCPLFRSFAPTTKKNRIFPRLSNLLSGTTSIAEVLPDYTRDLTFRFVVRDNFPGAGGLGWADVAFKSTALAGPFVVTAPNSTSTSWTTGDNVLVTWNVANTDQTPVNCKKVNILLSTDGGQNFNQTLASGVPNTGVACVLVPNSVSNTCRVRIEAADNIFFDISNVNFKIVAPTQAGFSVCGDGLVQRVCAPQDVVSTISTTGFAGFSEKIDLSLSGLPAGATVSFSQNNLAPGASATMTVRFDGTVSEGTYTATLTATSAGQTVTREYTFTVFNSDLSGLALLTPADGSTGNLQSPAFTWSALTFADFYEIQVATSPTFGPGSILASKSDLTAPAYSLPIILEKGKTYFWRVRARNECGESPWSEAYSLATLVEACAVYGANDLPKNLSGNGTPTVESKITIPAGGAVSDVNVKQLKGTHQAFKQLEVSLVSPAGTSVVLFKNKCGSNTYNFNMSLDDAAPTFPCPPPVSTVQPAKSAELLSAFNGQTAAGEWKLVAKDNEVGAGGTIDNFQLELCSAASLNPPFIVNNNPLQLQAGANAFIQTPLLKAEDANNTAAQLTFTLVSVPHAGELRINGQVLAPGAQFTQADIDAGVLRYYSYGQSSDDFRFIVTDGEGGMAAGKFLIQPFPVGTNEAAALEFSLAPNPADETVRLTFSESTNSDTRVAIFNAAGQLVLSRSLPLGQTVLTLDVAALPEGVYVVSVENEKGSGVRKLVVR